MKQKGAKIKLFKGEKFLFLILFIMLIATPMLIVFSKATLTKTNIEVERLKITIKGDVTGTGVYEAVIKVHPSVTSTIKVNVVAK